MRLPSISRFTSLAKTVGTNGVQVAMEACKVKVLAHALGPGGYGGLSLLNSIYASIAAVTCWGLNSSVADVLRRPGSAHVHDARRQTVIFAGILAICAIPMSAIWVCSIASQYEGILEPGALVYVVLLAPAVVLSSYNVGLIVGVGTTDQVLALRMASPAVGLACVFAASFFGLLDSPSRAFFFGVFPGVLVTAGFFALMRVRGIFSWTSLDRKIATRLLGLGGAFTLTSFIQEGGNLIVKSTIVASGAAGLSSVGYYTAAVTVCSVPLRIAQSYFGIYRARILSSSADDPDATRRELRRSTLVLFGVTAVAAVVLVVASGLVLRVFFNEDFIQARPTLVGIALTLPLKVATLPYVYRCLISGRYFSGLFTEISGSLGMLLGMLIFYEASNPNSVIWAHVLGAVIPVLIAPITACLHGRRLRAQS